MPLAEFINLTTNKTVQGFNFDGDYVYEVDGVPVKAPLGGTSLSYNGTTVTLNPLGLTSEGANSSWKIISQENVNTCDWTITVQNIVTGETKSGVLPFNADGKVYELECEQGTWVMASCGGYATETSWDGQGENECIRLKGTDEIINISHYSIDNYWCALSTEEVYGISYLKITPNFYNQECYAKNCAGFIVDELPAPTEHYCDIETTTSFWSYVAGQVYEFDDIIDCNQRLLENEYGDCISVYVDNRSEILSCATKNFYKLFFNDAPTLPKNKYPNGLFSQYLTSFEFFYAEGLSDIKKSSSREEILVPTYCINCTFDIIDNTGKGYFDNSDKLYLAALLKTMVRNPIDLLELGIKL